MDMQTPIGDSTWLSKSGINLRSMQHCDHLRASLHLLRAMVGYSVAMLLAWEMSAVESQVSLAKPLEADQGDSCKRVLLHRCDRRKCCLVCGSGVIVALHYTNEMVYKCCTARPAPGG